MATLNYEQDLKGALIVGVCVVLYIVGGEAGLYLSNQSFFYSPEGPGADPLFYHIRSDFVEGVCLGLTGFTSVAIGLYYRKRYPVYAWMAVWMSVLWSGGEFAQSVIILFKTTRLFTPPESTSSWLTFSEYLHDPLFRKAKTAVRILALAIGLLSSLYIARNRKREKLEKKG